MKKAQPIREDLIRAQWKAIRTWLGRPEPQASFAEASVLPGWTISDLVVHLGRTFTTLTGVSPAPGATPQTLRQYVAQYAPAADSVAEGTRDLARALSDDVLAGVDELADSGLQAIAAITSPVVLGPRGPLRHEDLLRTRLLELVVHGDDLSRSLPWLEPVPLVEPAVEEVMDALTAAYTEVGGGPLVVADPVAWIRQATGRAPSEDPFLPLL